MANEMICPTHGPYPAELGSCPFCSKGSSGGRPQAPSPMDAEDDMPTDFGAGGGYAAGAAGMGYGDDEAPTVLPGGGRRGGGRPLDIDEEKTNLGGDFQREAADVTEIEFKEVGPQAIFWVKDGPRRGRIHKIKDQMVIGRKDADLVVDDPKVSSIHAKIVYENDHYLIVDFRSKNGTCVNGERINAETILKENDQVKIGDVVFVLKILDK